MKMVLVAGLIIASAGFASAGAQTNQAADSPRYVITSGTANVSLQVERGEMRANGTFLQKITLTVGDIVVTADDAMMVAGNESAEFQLGANARVRFPTK